MSDGQERRYRSQLQMRDRGGAGPGPIGGALAAILLGAICPGAAEADEQQPAVPPRSSLESPSRPSAVARFLRGAPVAAARPPERSRRPDEQVEHERLVAAWHAARGSAARRDVFAQLLAIEAVPLRDPTLYLPTVERAVDARRHDELEVVCARALRDVDRAAPPGALSDLFHACWHLHFAAPDLALECRSVWDEVTQPDPDALFTDACEHDDLAAALIAQAFRRGDAAQVEALFDKFAACNGTAFLGYEVEGERVMLTVAAELARQGRPAALEISAARYQRAARSHLTAGITLLALGVIAAATAGVLLGQLPTTRDLDTTATYVGTGIASLFVSVGLQVAGAAVTASGQAELSQGRRLLGSSGLSLSF